jgi:hypothetical protein
VIATEEGLGIQCRLCDFSTAHEQIWHILDVLEGSPASVAGLQAFDDYVVGSRYQLLKAKDDFGKLVSRCDGKPLEIVVYNRKSDTLRDVYLIPDSKWGGGGKGSLGCDIGYGMLHRISLENERSKLDRLKSTSKQKLHQGSSHQHSAHGGCNHSHNDQHSHNHPHKEQHDHHGADDHACNHNHHEKGDNGHNCKHDDSQKDNHSIGHDGVHEHSHENDHVHGPGCQHKHDHLEDHHHEHQHDQGYPHKHDQRSLGHDHLGGTSHHHDGNCDHDHSSHKHSHDESKLPSKKTSSFLPKNILGLANPQDDSENTPLLFDSTSNSTLSTVTTKKYSPIAPTSVEITKGGLSVLEVAPSLVSPIGNAEMDENSRPKPSRIVPISIQEFPVTPNINAEKSLSWSARSPKNVGK